MANESVRIHGHVLLTVTAPDGTLVARAEGTNTVVDGGRKLLAQLLAGAASEPAFSLVAGIGDGATVNDLTMLFDTNGLPAVPVTAEADGGMIKLTGSFPASDANRYIREAGLMLTCKVGDSEESTLYNRALVKPSQQLREGEVLTLTWTLSFAPQTI